MSLFEKLKKLGLDTITAYSESVPSRSAAALAYRGVFSLAPLLFISVLVMSVFVGQATAQQEIRSVIGTVLDDESAAMVENLLLATFRRTSGDYTLASLAGVAFLLYAASALFKELKIALHAVWGLPPAPKKGVLGFITTQTTAIAMVLLVGFFFLSLLVVNVAVSVLDTYVFQGQLISLRWGSLLGSVLATVLLIALMYRLIPDVRLPWSDLWVGAVVTAVLMMVGLGGISLYLSLSNVGSAFGAAAALIILLLWLYYTALVFLFGASFARAYALNFGSKQASRLLEQFETESPAAGIRPA
ncbi:MAG TPA: YihY/virulence factor BrkB family protein [Anaerolineae bacterium]|nr:YihY/virulence factor BrkB family protein [Anaerolineae bacterium]